MRAGISSTQITSSGQVSTGVIESDDILNGTIVNADINAAAAIASGKIDLSAVAQDVIPDANATRYCGTGAKAWLYGYFSLADIGNFVNSVDPNVTNSQVIGTAAKTWKEIYVNSIKGSAAGQILVFGLLGV